MAVELFQKYLLDNSINEIEILISDEKTHTALEAAQVHKVPVSNIVKSLLINADDTFVLILTPGDRRLGLDKWKSLLNVNEVRMANADEVKEITGYSIGGVPPFGHSTSHSTYIEEGFDSSRELVAAAGSANSVFKVTLEKLMTYAGVEDIGNFYSDIK